MNRYDGNKQDQDDDTLDTLAHRTSLAFVATLSLVVILCTRGVLLTILWQWFITPVFGVPPLTLKQGLGIALFTGCLLSFFRISTNNDDDDDDPPTFDDLYHHNVKEVVNMAILFVLGLVVYYLM